jgi:Asp-tRNA(Asn)/Glu-tRNA(Gln) amidotransferase B subunit
MNTLVEHVNKLIRDNPDKTQQARKNPSLAGWFVGQVMKDTDGDYPRGCNPSSACPTRHSGSTIISDHRG